MKVMVELNPRDSHKDVILALEKLAKNSECFQSFRVEPMTLKY